MDKNLNLISCAHNDITFKIRIFYFVVILTVQRPFLVWTNSACMFELFSALRIKTGGLIKSNFVDRFHRSQNNQKYPYR